MVKYLSICSGIEAATVAWHPLGWKPLAFSEIEAFPRAVLAHHYPDVPLHGDFTVLRHEPWIVDADVLVGGTPCQAFSVAGLRNSLSDERGNLSLEFVRLADAIDNVRKLAGKDSAIIVWENVPGVLSVKDNAFGCFLAALAGDVAPYVPPRGKWTNAGVVAGPARQVAWRVLDAQYFGLAQRRRRVFVVASARDGFDPAAVLLEFEGVRRDTPPRREAGQATAGTIDASLGRSRGAGTNPGALSHWDGDFPHPTLNQSHNTGGVGQSNQELFSQRGAYLAPAICMAHGQGGAEVASERRATLTCIHEAPIVAHTLKGEGFDASEDGTGRGTPLVAVPLQEVGKRTGVSTDDPRAGIGIGQDGDPMFTLQAGAQHGVAHAIPFDTTQITSPSNYSRPQSGDPCHPLAAGAHPPAVAYAFQPRIARNGRGDMGEVVNALNAQSGETGKGDAAPCVAYTTKLHNTKSNQAGKIYKEYTVGLDKSSPPPALLTNMAVRRLTPVECSRLQGFPDDYLLSVTWRGKCPPPDGPMYKALGNSMAVPCMAWIGRRINHALA
jgi:DNA (cytosine-5)-methyltransferase 1